MKMFETDDADRDSDSAVFAENGKYTAFIKSAWAVTFFAARTKNPTDYFPGAQSRQFCSRYMYQTVVFSNGDGYTKPNSPRNGLNKQRSNLKTAFLCEKTQVDVVLFSVRVPGYEVQRC